MKKTISLIAGALLLATGTTAQVPQVLGIWELDLKSSVLPATFPLASETAAMTFAPMAMSSTWSLESSPMAIRTSSR